MVSFSETLCVMLQKHTHTHRRRNTYTIKVRQSCWLASISTPSSQRSLFSSFTIFPPSLLSFLLSLPSFSSLTPFSTLLPLISIHSPTPPPLPSPPLSEACWEMCQCIRACSSSGSSNSMALYPNMDWGEAGRGVTAVNSVRKGQRTALGPDTVMRRWDKTTFKIKIH